MRKRKIPRLPLILLLLMVIANAAVILMRDDIIIRTGIRQYRTADQTAKFLLAAAVLINLANIVRMLLGNRHKGKEALQPETGKDAVLSARGKLQGGELLEMFTKYMDGTWNQTTPDRLTEECIRQFEGIRDYRARLHTLLENNDAAVLSDTEDMLGNVEQQMFRNLRKVINYLSIADPLNEGDVRRTNEIMEECVSMNREHLKQVQDFIYALTDYLNHQGEDSAGMDMLEVYKNTILQSIQADKNPDR